jgi:hypothetical protein
MFVEVAIAVFLLKTLLIDFPHYYQFYSYFIVSIIITFKTKMHSISFKFDQF